MDARVGAHRLALTLRNILVGVALYLHFPVVFRGTADAVAVAGSGSGAEAGSTTNQMMIFEMH